jgi:proteic killer suppression protein
MVYMWQIYEAPRARKSLKRLPLEILKRYEKWKDIVQISGPQGLRSIRGFRDEALTGKLFGYRSSRLNIQYRVIYRVVANEVYVEVEDVNAHKY